MAQELWPRFCKEDIIYLFYLLVCSIYLKFFRYRILCIAWFFCHHYASCLELFTVFNYSIGVLKIVLVIIFLAHLMSMYNLSFKKNNDIEFIGLKSYFLEQGIFLSYQFIHKNTYQKNYLQNISNFLESTWKLYSI